MPLSKHRKYSAEKVEEMQNYKKHPKPNQAFHLGPRNLENHRKPQYLELQGLEHVFFKNDPKRRRTVRAKHHLYVGRSKTYSTLYHGESKRGGRNAYKMHFVDFIPGKAHHQYHNQKAAA